MHFQIPIEVGINHTTQNEDSISQILSLDLPHPPPAPALSLDRHVIGVEITSNVTVPWGRREGCPCVGDLQVLHVEGSIVVQGC